jgi:putative flippase GtrA
LTILQLVERLWRVQFVRFAAVGTAAFVVDTTVLYGALAAGLGLYSGRLVSYLVAATFTWYGNRRLTFFELRAHGRRGAATEWIRFLAANAVGGAVNYATYAALVSQWATAHALPVIGVAAGAIAGLSVNFTLSKWLVFRGSRAR